MRTSDPDSGTPACRSSLSSPGRTSPHPIHPFTSRTISVTLTRRATPAGDITLMISPTLGRAGEMMTTGVLSALGGRSLAPLLLTVLICVHSPALTLSSAACQPCTSSLSLPLVSAPRNVLHTSEKRARQPDDDRACTSRHVCPCYAQRHASPRQLCIPYRKCRLHIRLCRQTTVSRSQNAPENLGSRVCM